MIEVKKLLEKFKAIGLSDVAINIFKDYLQGRKQIPNVAISDYL